jgi:hypothetical protein
MERYWTCRPGNSQPFMPIADKYGAIGVVQGR